MTQSYLHKQKSSHKTYLSPNRLPGATVTAGVCFMLVLAAEGGSCCHHSSVQLRGCVLCANASRYKSVSLLQWCF